MLVQDGKTGYNNIWLESELGKMLNAITELMRGGGGVRRTACE